MLGKLRYDLKAIMERDPAAQGVFAALFLYPSFHVLLFHRIAVSYTHLTLPTTPYV